MNGEMSAECLPGQTGSERRTAKTTDITSLTPTISLALLFWAFSNYVAPAVIKNGRLVASTTGGTSMACVLEHLAQTRPASAIVVTDGYIERLCPSLVEKVASIRLHALVTRDGIPAELRRAGIPYTQLEKVPS